MLPGSRYIEFILYELKKLIGSIGKTIFILKQSNWKDLLNGKQKSHFAIDNREMFSEMIETNKN